MNVKFRNNFLDIDLVLLFDLALLFEIIIGIDLELSNNFRFMQG